MVICLLVFVQNFLVGLVLTNWVDDRVGCLVVIVFQFCYIVICGGVFVGV